jgi:hypothetical protein
MLTSIIELASWKLLVTTIKSNNYTIIIMDVYIYVEIMGMSVCHIDGVQSVSNCTGQYTGII